MLECTILKIYILFKNKLTNNYFKAQGKIVQVIIRFII